MPSQLLRIVSPVLRFHSSRGDVAAAKLRRFAIVGPSLQPYRSFRCVGLLVLTVVIVRQRVAGAMAKGREKNSAEDRARQRKGKTKRLSGTENVLREFLGKS